MLQILDFHVSSPFTPNISTTTTNDDQNARNHHHA